MTVQQLLLSRFGGPEAFELIEAPRPEPGPGELRVRALAASVQFTDVILRKGQYPDLKERPPLVLGYDIIGEVEAVGPKVTDFSEGDRVADLTMIGSYASARLLSANQVVKVPDTVDPAEASAMVLSGLTAYQLLFRHAKVRAGQRALIHGAAGAVGQALLALGQREGLEMFGTCRAQHADLVASFGATPIDYQKEDFTKVLEDGVDVVFDGIALGGFGPSFSVLKKGGFLSAYGFSKAVQQDASFWVVAKQFMQPFLLNLLPNGRRAGFYSITKLRQKRPDWFREDLSALMGLLADGALHPRIADRLSLHQVPDAHRRLERGGLDGKLVITRFDPARPAPASEST